MRLGLMCTPCSGFRSPQHGASCMPLAHHANCAWHSVSVVMFVRFSSCVGCLTLRNFVAVNPIHPVLLPTRPCSRVTLHFTTRTSRTTGASGKRSAVSAAPLQPMLPQLGARLYVPSPHALSCLFFRRSVSADVQRKFLPTCRYNNKQNITVAIKSRCH